MQVLPAQQGDEPDQIETALQFRAGMLKILGGRDARLRLQQFGGATRRRREEGDTASRRRPRNGANERQMPDHIANSRFDLNDRGRRHIDCRSKGCDMCFVM
jgi:hypothetical protein